MPIVIANLKVKANLQVDIHKIILQNCFASFTKKCFRHLRILPSFAMKFLYSINLPLRVE